MSDDKKPQPAGQKSEKDREGWKPVEKGHKPTPMGSDHADFDKPPQRVPDPTSKPAPEKPQASDDKK